MLRMAHAAPCPARDEAPPCAPGPPSGPSLPRHGRPPILAPQGVTVGCPRKMQPTTQASSAPAPRDLHSKWSFLCAGVPPSLGPLPTAHAASAGPCRNVPLQTSPCRRPCCSGLSSNAAPRTSPGGAYTEAMLNSICGRDPRRSVERCPPRQPVFATLLRFSPSTRHPSLKCSCVSVHMCVAHAPGHLGSTRGGVLREQHLPATAGAQWWSSGPAGQGRGERRRDLASA